MGVVILLSAVGAVLLAAGTLLWWWVGDLWASDDHKKFASPKRHTAELNDHDHTPAASPRVIARGGVEQPSGNGDRHAADG